MRVLRPSLGPNRRLRTIVPAVITMTLALLAPPAGGAAAQEPKVAGAYNEVTVDGRYTNLGLEGVEHAAMAYAAMYKVTGDPHQRAVFEALLDRMHTPLLVQDFDMVQRLCVQVLDDPFLLSHPKLVTIVNGYADTLVQRYTTVPDQLLNTGGIRTLNGNASFLVAYGDFLDREAAAARGPSRADLQHKLQAVDKTAIALLDRLVELQFTLAEATDRFDNPRWAGGFPYVVDAADGTMGSYDVSTWSPMMLSLSQYSAVSALAEGFGRYHKASYNQAAAAGARLLLATDKIDPNVVYAGDPPGFPLDGAKFEFGEETGETPYLITYGWSPNAIGDMGTTLKALIDNRVTVPRSLTWAQTYWKGNPPPWVLDPRTFWDGLAAKVAYTHRYIEATQLPVAADFPWIDLSRTTFPGTGDDDIRRGGWYNGSGRGNMSAVYSRIAISGYVASGGDNVELLMRAGRWWDNMIVWE